MLQTKWLTTGKWLKEEAMRYHLLGKSGLKVSELCLGTMTFGTEFGWGASKKESRKVFDSYVQAGGNFFDTANHYTKGSSEALLGEFMGADRHRCVVATKYTLSFNAEDPNAGGNHRKSMVQALEASLKRLRTDYIDLYWVHIWDQMTPCEEMMRALDDMVKMGKILYVGISDAPSWVVARCNTLAEWRGWTPFVGLQLQYSLLERTIEREYFSMAQEMGLSIATWGSVGFGVLSGKYAKTSSHNPASDARLVVNKKWADSLLTPRNLAIADVVLDVAKETGKTSSQVALAWVRQKNPRMIPIVGAKTEAQLLENLGCLSLTLSPAQMNRLDQASAIELGFPTAFLKQADICQLVHGKFFDLMHEGR